MKRENKIPLAHIKDGVEQYKTLEIHRKDITKSGDVQIFVSADDQKWSFIR